MPRKTKYRKQSAYRRCVRGRTESVAEWVSAQFDVHLEACDDVAHASNDDSRFGAAALRFEEMIRTAGLGFATAQACCGVEVQDGIRWCVARFDSSSSQMARCELFGVRLDTARGVSGMAVCPRWLVN